MLDELGLDLPIVPIKDRIKEAIKKFGRLFFSIRESAALLGITGFRVYNLVYQYRLDAFLIGGEYRIPWTALVCLEEELPEIRRQFFGYLRFVESREIKGFFAARKTAKEGASLDVIKSSLNRTDLSEQMIAQILARKLPARQQSVLEANVQDWYDIPSMRLPEEADVEEWAELLGCKTISLCSLKSPVSYPVMYDYLVDHEVVNLPVPYQILPDTKEDNEDDKQQLLLFGGK